MSRPLVFALSAILGIWSQSVQAQQTLYQQVGDRWFIYKEPSSCVLYGDFATGTMLRVSNRIDEGRIYVMAVNDAWKMLLPRLNESVTLTLSFPDLNRGYASAGIVAEQPDGRVGVAGNAFPVEEVFRALSMDKDFVLGGLFAGHHLEAKIETFPGQGAAMAITHLTECSLQWPSRSSSEAR